MKLLPALSTTLLFGIATLVHASEHSSINELKWLAGCWASVGGETGSGEQWTMPAGNTLFGVSRSVKGGKTVAYEFMQIRTNDAGGIEFIARPSGQPGATFLLKSLTKNEVIFENPKHDFPQRVIYRIENPASLEARIEGDVKGVTRTVNFPMQRIACDPAN